MNESASDGSDTDSQLQNERSSDRSSEIIKSQQSPSTALTLAKSPPPVLLSEIDFLTYQARIQKEARAALAQGKPFYSLRSCM